MPKIFLTEAQYYRRLCDHFLRCTQAGNCLFMQVLSRDVEVLMIDMMNGKETKDQQTRDGTSQPDKSKKKIYLLSPYTKQAFYCIFSLKNFPHFQVFLWSKMKICISISMLQKQANTTSFIESKIISPSIYPFWFWLLLSYYDLYTPVVVVRSLWYKDIEKSYFSQAEQIKSNIKWMDGRNNTTFPPPSRYICH